MLLAANGILQSICSIGIALLTKRAFDQSNDSILENTFSFWSFATAFIVIIFALSFLRVAERVATEHLGQDYVHEVRAILFKYITLIDDIDLRKLRTGAVALRFTGDLSSLRIWVSQGYSKLIASSLNLSFTLTALVMIQWQLGLAIALILGIGMVFSTITGSRLRTASRLVRRRRSQLAANTNEKILNMASVRALGGIRRERARLERQSSRLRSAATDRALVVGLFRAIADGSTYIAACLTVLIGGILVADGSTTTGTIMAALSVVSLLSSSVKGISRSGEYWHNAQVAREKLNDYLGRFKPEKMGSKRKKSGNGDLILQDVQLPFSDVIITGHIKPGSIIAITGNNGVGKSTLLSILGKVSTPKSGKILLNDRDIQSIRETSFRTIVGITGDRFPLLKGSLKRNICYRRPNATIEEINKAIESTNLSKLIETLPGNLGFVIAENAANLSVGQRKKVELTRAVMGTPEILLLDEPDTGLDPSSLDCLIALIRSYSGTVIFVSQEKRLLEIANEIWTLSTSGIEMSAQEPISNNGTLSNIYRVSSDDTNIKNR